MFIRYQHPSFPVGTIVYIDPQIKNTYPASPIADRHLVVADARVPFLALFFGAYKNEVPVWFDGIWFVEERFVRRLQHSTKD